MSSYFVKSYFIGAGTGGAGGAVAPPTKLLGELLVHPAPQIFFCNLQLQVTFNTKILENFPASGGFAPDPTVLCVGYTFSKNTYCKKLYFEI